MNPEISSQATDSTEAPEVSQEDEITILHVGRQSTHCWTVEAIDFEETIKKIKVKVKGVNNLPRELRIIVEFDDQGQAIGEAQALLENDSSSVPNTPLEGRHSSEDSNP
ncbi:hypothetical protein Fmac_028876 [Flemingia macrophylla]|uniref:Uncharacterized protein n=1 Tax=Flemingia macrophylla TaxID=520843 RepID=A0ABD1L8S1_9FABA